MIDVTAEFRVFRDLLRMVWNFGMRSHPDSDFEFLEIERALFIGLFFSRLSPNAPATNEVDGTTFYPQLVVTSPSKSALFLGESGQWESRELDGKFEGAFVRLFDFDWTDDASRDFRYVECLCDESGTLALVDASAATIGYLER